MNRYLKNSLLSLCAGIMLLFTGCIEEMEPYTVVSQNQIENLPEVQSLLLSGIVSYMVTHNSWGTSGYYTNDWGYPCQMFFREICGEDIPVYSSSYNYWNYYESCQATRVYPYYTFNFYYRLVKKCNSLISTIDSSSMSDESSGYLAAALTFRALAYLDIARLFEFKKTGIESLDDEAESRGIWGLTIPITTENTTFEDTKHNPRAPFYTMYRFILTDLNMAEEYIGNLSRSDNKTLPDLSVVYGLKARLWMELGSRFEENPDDLQQMIASDANDDSYDVCGVTSALECYRKAREYARSAETGYTPVTEEQWHNTQTGFNTANQAWMWCMSVSQTEQIPSQYYNTLTGVIASEPQWGMSFAYNAYRCIGSNLYGKISTSDWRRRSWINPDDAGNTSAYENYATLLDAENWAKLPKYSNLKFRPGSGNIDDKYVGLLVDMPLMRVEEMMFIDMEATARIDGVSAGVEKLKDFMNGYRYSDGSYSPAINTLDDFVSEMMVQKRIEFWGEGICYFDYKRLNLQVRRKDNDNYLATHKINSKKGYTAPWMDFYILDYETSTNTAVILNPDTSGSITVSDDY